MKRRYACPRYQLYTSQLVPNLLPIKKKNSRFSLPRVYSSNSKFIWSTDPPIFSLTIHQLCQTHTYTRPLSLLTYIHPSHQIVICTSSHGSFTTSITSTQTCTIRHSHIAKILDTNEEYNLNFFYTDTHLSFSRTVVFPLLFVSLSPISSVISMLQL